MRWLKILIFSPICLLIATVEEISAQVTPSNSATGQIIAEIVPVFSAHETSQLNFGRFSPGRKNYSDSPEYCFIAGKYL
jgi:hypothetical protein